MPPETEENGAHAQEREANCSLQRMRCSAKSENARECGLGQADVLCRLWNMENTNKQTKERKKKVGFSLF